MGEFVVAKKGFILKKEKGHPPHHHHHHHHHHPPRVMENEVKKEEIKEKPHHRVSEGASEGKGKFMEKKGFNPFFSINPVGASPRRVLLRRSYILLSVPQQFLFARTIAGRIGIGL